MAFLSKVKIGESTYDVKDKLSRDKLCALLGLEKTDAALNSWADKALGSAAWEDYQSTWDASTDAKKAEVPSVGAVKSYVDSQIESIPTFDVVIDPDGTESGPSVPASKDTFHKIYMVPTGKISGSYVEWITIRSGEGTTESPYTYAWEKIGTTEVDLSGYVKKTTTIAGIDLQDNITVAEMQSALDIKTLAHKDAGSVTIATADSITMDSYTPTGDVELNDFTQTSTVATISAKADYTPAGSVTGTVVPTGSVEVTLKDAESTTEAGLTYAAYTPAGSVTLAKDNTGSFQVSGTIDKPAITVNDDTVDTFVKSLKAGETDAASFTEGTFTPASINADKFFNAGALPSKAADTFTAGSFTKGNAVNAAIEGVVAAMGTGDDAETLIFTTAQTDAVMDHDATFVAPTFTEGAFTQGSLPSIDVEQGFDGGSKAADTFSANKLPVVDGTATAVTAVTAELASAPVFTGDKFAPAFTGTEVEEMKVTKAEYVKSIVNTATFTGNASGDVISAAFAGTKAEQLIPTEVKYDKATANGATFTGDAKVLTGEVNSTDKKVDVDFTVNA